MVTAGQRSFRQSRLVRTLIPTAVAVGIGGLIIWGYVEGRGEADREAERERPINEPLRVSMKNGMPVVTLDNETQRNSGIETARLESAPFQQQVRAYGMVLDLARLTELSNNYANAKAQLQTANAKLVASKAAFERAQASTRGRRPSRSRSFRQPKPHSRWTKLRSPPRSRRCARCRQPHFRIGVLLLPSRSSRDRR